jgi:RNA polymerase sigma-70 factor, ECF subfamily
MEDSVSNAARNDPADPDPCHPGGRRPALSLVPPLPADSPPTLGSPPGAGSPPSAGSPAAVGSPAAADSALTADSPPTAGSDAIAELWRRHGDALLRFALKLTRGDRQRAEDIVQETLLRAWRHPEVVGGGDRAIRAWLFTVTRHVAIDMWRARCRTDETVDDRQTELPDPAEHIDQVVTALTVRAAIAQLSPQHREVIVGMYFGGQSAAELAHTLRIPLGTVKSRAYYGLRQLRRQLTAHPAAPAATTARRISA